MTVAIAAAALPLASLAQSASTASELAPVVVTGNPLRSADVAAPYSVLTGDELIRRRGSTLAETLDGLQGVSSSWFGPSSNRPTIRGFDGERVRVLGNGQSSVDASTLSFDHAVPIDPLIVQRLEVLRGPAALAYGGSAIGGVVNAIDNRIPKEPIKGLAGTADARFGGAARERSGAGIIEAGQGDVAVHVDVFDRRSSDLRVPRFVPISDGVALEPTDRITNSGGDARGGAVGASLFGAQGRIGASVDHYDSRYGIVVEPDVLIRMQRDQASLDGEWRNPDAAVRAVRATAHLTRYRHEEVEGTGEIGTMFRSRATEWRLEAEHAPWNGWRGIFGLHLEDMDFSALGEEAFVPQTSTRRQGLYWVEERHGAWGTTRAGIRVDRAQVGSQGDADPAAARFGAPQSRTFDLVSASVSQVVPLAKGWTVTGAGSLVERAPTYFELYADGVHLATAAFERGDPALSTERGANLDLTLGWVSGPHRLQAGVWAAHFGRYISLDATGVDVTVPDGSGGFETFPEYAFRAVPARWRGIELAGRTRLADRPWTLDLSGQLDLSRGRNADTGEALPRIAPLRTVLALDAASGAWGARVAWTHTSRQDRVPATDSETDGYSRLDLQLSRAWGAEGVRGLWFVRLDNATNALGFNAGSIETVRRLAPLPARSLKVGLRIEV